ncbi:high nitrogen upregulated cytochrome P450 monooxygenase 2 [Pholiota conissans]|uniref:High nitrogen upregulated cytochrome P450 monooxygenase 2 n=1 Tax=Pholiota conissans TaxID=109636 RepID=A0A9P5YNQ8_9AGAR|nr:high nitrogen upregulated cytochrome P450 monooxygenase 2 [Pholiota conissans]
MIYAIWLDILLALATHFWLRNYRPKSLLLLIAPILTIPGFLAYHLHSDPPSRHATFQIYAVFLGALLSSIIVYRVSPLHPLAKYPGPTLCKISKLWTMFIAYRGGLHLYHQALHVEYGPIVRVGPNELSIADKSFIPLILGSSGLPKGPLWEGRSFSSTNEKVNNTKLLSVKDPQRHAQLRKPWDQAFKATPLHSYGEILVEEVGKFTNLLEEKYRTSEDGKAHVDIARWISYLSFDFMGYMAFGTEFNLVRNGDKDGVFENLESAIFWPSVLQHIPWVTPMMHAVPFAGTSIKKFAAFAMTQAKIRCGKNAQKRDLFHFMLDALESDPKKDPLPFIFNTSVTAIVAGSDTTATALCTIVYYLMRYPASLARLRRELDEAFSFEDCAPVNISQLAELEFLNAVANEALRLQPPLPNSLQRAPPEGSEGKMCGTTYIPEGTAVIIPPYTLHRDPEYFSPRSEEFWPERWIVKDDPTVVLDLDAFIPFSYGPANCAGKPLAMQELRYITAVLVRQFDIVPETGFDLETWEEGLKDRFLLAKGPLPVVISPRQSAR